MPSTPGLFLGVMIVVAGTLWAGLACDATFGSAASAGDIPVDAEFALRRLVRDGALDARSAADADLLCCRPFLTPCRNLLVDE
jgi:hypothetical protein